MVERLRVLVQYLSFFILIWGGKFGIRLGSSLPCFACPFVGTCAGHCYLMVLQRGFVGFMTPFAEIAAGGWVNILTPLGLFLLFLLPLSKLWCGWICPFCLFQDWVTWIRKKLGIRQMILTRKTRDTLKPVKFILLGLLILIPLAIANFGLHPDWALPFCQICPAKPILPLFAGNFDHFHLNFTNGVTLGFTLLSMGLTGGFLVGIFFRERFFCMFCPMLALIHIFARLSPLKFEKNIHGCSGCGNCQRVCPADIRDVHLEKAQKNVLTQDCMGCMTCVESCPSDTVLSYKWAGIPIFSSSKTYVAQKWSKK